jgi:Trk K+ transport system NAD-binding subunit
MNSILLLALRRLRAPLILMIAIYAIAIIGLVLIPGVDAAGRTWHMTTFQALYFVSYTASTIGFGEIPQPFTDDQRLWVTFVIFMSVTSWAYLVAVVLGMLQDHAFQQAIVWARFRRTVRRLGEPFYIICGFGETGMTVGRTLDALGQRFVAVDPDQRQIDEAELLDLRSDVPAIAADARLPETLLAAGLTKPECRGVLALSKDDDTNLAVGIAVRLLNPRARVLCRAHDRHTNLTMSAFGTDQIINPFTEFGEYLALAMHSPGTYRLLTWLTALPGTALKTHIPAPPGHWIVCGYGRFGREVVAAIGRGGFDVGVIEPDGAPIDGPNAVRGDGTNPEALRAAGIDRAVGIVAGTDDDIVNLAIAEVANSLRPDLFIIARQNLRANRPLFEAFGADVTMVSSEVIANECLAIVKTPLLSAFLDVVRAHDDVWADALVERLHSIVGDGTPEFWSFRLNAAEAPALAAAIEPEGLPVSVGDLLRDTTDRACHAGSIALYIVRGREAIVLPGDEVRLLVGDHLLFAGTDAARRDQQAMLRNVNVRDYVLLGKSIPGGLLWRWLAS